MAATGSRTGGGSPTAGNTTTAKNPFAGVTSTAGGGTDAGMFGFGDEAEDTDKIEFQPGGDNAAYWEQEYESALSWQDALRDRWLKEVPAMAEAFGESTAAYKAWVNRQMGGMMEYVTDMWHSLSQGGLPGSTDLTQSPQGMESLFQMGMSYLAGRDQRLQSFWVGTKGGKIPGSGGRGGGGGARRPTAAEIRANFDLNELAAGVTEIFRGTILDDAKDPRAIASAYVESIVRNPEQKLDFEAFVKEQAKATPRYASLYRNKPKAMSDAQYIMPYLNSAMQMARPKEAVNIAAGGAQLGADPAAFRSRLNRTNATTTSAPFISSMEQRMTGLKRILKG